MSTESNTTSSPTPIPNPNTDQEVLKIRELSNTFYSLQKDFEQAFSNRNLDFLCLINTRWFDKWKVYCDYQYIMNKNKHPEIYSKRPDKRLILKPELFPGEITNSDLIVPPASFLNTKEEGDLNTLILRPDVKLNVDFTVISEEMWRLLVNVYGGGPRIPRSLDRYDYYKGSIKGYSACLSVLFIPSREIISKEIIESMECHRFWFELPIEVFDVKEHIRYCLGHKNNNELRLKIVLGQGNEFKEPKIELFSNLRQLPIDELKKLLLNNIEAIQEGKTIDINTVLGNVNSVEQYLNNGYEFVLCEYYLTSSLFFNSASKEEQERDYSMGMNRHMIINYDQYSNEDFGYEQINDDYIDSNPHRNMKGKDKWKKNKINGSYQYQNQGKGQGYEMYSHHNYSSHYDIKSNIKLDANNNKKGIVGLSNLGNTCYMNTSLQCLSNLFDLSEYFLKDLYKNNLVDSNKKENENFINGYADVIKALWYGNQNNFPPSQFKSTIHLINKMFIGNNQHDMHEFICFLLDSLHEGLNKAKKNKEKDKDKPLLIEDKANDKDNSISNSKGNEDEDQLAKIERLNQSIISHLIFGILKSTVLCPNESCNNISVIYEPYTTLSLPLASDSIKTTRVQCFMIFYDISISPIEFNLIINSTTTIDAFRVKVAELFLIRKDSFLITKLEKDFTEVNPLTTFTIESFLTNDKPLFLIQISPEVFNESFESLTHLKTIYNKLNGNNEFLDKASKQDDTGNSANSGNNGFNVSEYDPMKSIDNKKWIKGVFYQYTYLTNSKEHYLNQNPTLRIVFPRIIFINKEWTFAHLYNILIDYFSSLYTQPKEVLFKDIETHLDKSVCSKSSKTKLKPIPLPFIMLFEDIKEKKIKPLVIDENWKEQIVPYDNAVHVLLDKKLPNVEDYSQHMVQFKLAWLKEYEDKVKTLNNREILLYTPSITKKGGLDKCIEKFIIKEQLSEDNKWHCPKCNQDQLADKIIEIVKLPTYLILHLKRFNHHMKIDTEIDFPIRGLDMRGYVQVKEEEKVNCVYDLAAIGNHSGGLNGGHYYAYAKNNSDGLWYEFNDSYVKQIGENELISSNAYVLFYKKRKVNDK